MAFTEIERAKYENLVSNLIQNRRIQATENGFEFNNQSIELFETHPSTSNEKDFFNISVAKITYIRTTDIWKISWMRGSLKWQGYRKHPEVKKLGEALFIIAEDEDRLFWKLSSAT